MDNLSSWQCGFPESWWKQPFKFKTLTWLYTFISIWFQKYQIPIQFESLFLIHFISWTSPKLNYSAFVFLLWPHVGSGLQAGSAPLSLSRFVLTSIHPTLMVFHGFKGGHDSQGFSVQKISHGFDKLSPLSQGFSHSSSQSSQRRKGWKCSIVSARFQLGMQGFSNSKLSVTR